MPGSEYEHIAKDPKYRSGKARILGTGLTVAGVVIMHKGGDSLEAIAAAYPGLTVENLQEALAYAGEHKEEITRDIHALTNPPKGYRIGPKGVLLKK
jgi:uncharacterized protein (DUF433 family)